MKTKLRVKCKNCSNWKTIEVEKVFLNTSRSDSGLKLFSPAYLILKTEKCAKCNQIMVKEKEIIGKRKSAA